MPIVFASCISDSSVINNLDSELHEVIAQNSYVGGEESLILPESHELELIPQDPKNPLTAQKVELGQLLFHETALGTNAKMKEGMGTFSCASCHHAAAGFQAGVAQGIGDGGLGFGIRGEARFANENYNLKDLDVQPLRSPTVLNSAYQELMLWNGQFGATGLNEGTEAFWTDNTPKAVNKLGYQGVETQAIAGLDVHRMLVDEDFVNANQQYKDLFDVAFSDVPQENRYNNEIAGLAIAAYERTVLANQSPFQNWLKNRSNSLTSGELRGAIVFFGKGECAECHSGPALSSMTFHALGMRDLDATQSFVHGLDENVRKGRGGFTENATDNYKFKTPQLYSIQDSPHFGHGASFKSIDQVIRYKNRGVKENANVPQEYISSSFKSLDLTESEIQDLTQFIRTGLYDNNLQRYTPSSVLSGQCIPNNDGMSQNDLGCS